MSFDRARVLVFTMMTLSSVAVLAQETSYVQTQDLVYAQPHGIGLLMDVFVPKGDKNGLAIIDIMSGAWHSDRGKIKDHTRSQTFQIFCQKGYTVFAIRPGSITKFGALEMRDNMNVGIRWVKDHAKEYGIDPDRLGLTGASAGGHLASLTALTAHDETTADGKKATTGDTRVKAVAVFFPPTDFLTYGKTPESPNGSERLRQIARRLAYPDRMTEPSTDELIQLLTKISPAQLVTEKAPPFLLVHGDADPVVPLQQSEVLMDALKKAGIPVELVVKKGGGHAWLTIHEEVQTIGDWFDKHLKD